MKCPECATEMKYYKKYEIDEDGYFCIKCGFEKPLVTIAMPEEELTFFLSLGKEVQPVQVPWVQLELPFEEKQLAFEF